MFNNSAFILKASAGRPTALLLSGFTVVREAPESERQRRRTEGDGCREAGLDRVKSDFGNRTEVTLIISCQRAGEDPERRSITDPPGLLSLTVCQGDTASTSSSEGHSSISACFLPVGLFDGTGGLFLDFGQREPARISLGSVSRALLLSPLSQINGFNGDARHHKVS